MKREPTEEQRAIAKERRERFRAIVQKIGKMTEEERGELARRIPVIATCEGHTLSLHNQCLLALQCPSATLVGGFRQWKKQGRAVKKGEHGHMIWVPSVQGEISIDIPQPGEIDESERRELRFLMGTVFDISQTAEMGVDDHGN